VVELIKLRLHLGKLLLLLILNLLVVTDCSEEIVLEGGDVQVLQQDGLVVFFELRHKLCDLLLVNSRRPVVEKRAFD